MAGAETGDHDASETTKTTTRNQNAAKECLAQDGEMRQSVAITNTATRKLPTRDIRRGGECTIVEVLRANHHRKRGFANDNEIYFQREA